MNGESEEQPLHQISNTQMRLLFFNVVDSLEVCIEDSTSHIKHLLYFMANLYNLQLIITDSYSYKKIFDPINDMSISQNLSSLIIFYRSRILTVIFYAAPFGSHTSKMDKEVLEGPLKSCVRVMLPYVECYDEWLAKQYHHAAK